MKFTKLFIIAASCFALISCQQQFSDEVYSCDPEVDTWVKKNLRDIRVMTRSEWNELDEDYKGGAYGAFTPEQKQQFWLEKLDHAMELDWTIEEKEHIAALKNAVIENPIWLNPERTETDYEAYQLFEYKWVEYAQEVLGWTTEQIAGIAYSGNNLLNTQGLVLKTEESMNKLKSSSERNCDCHPTESAMFMCMGRICVVGNCNPTVWKCGLFWAAPCVGLCQ